MSGTLVPQARARHRGNAIMRFTDLHSWDVTPERAREIQLGLRGQVVRLDQFGPVRLVAGVDVGFDNDG